MEGGREAVTGADSLSFLIKLNDSSSSDEQYKKYANEQKRHRHNRHKTTAARVCVDDFLLINNSVGDR